MCDNTVHVVDRWAALQEGRRGQVVDSLAKLGEASRARAEGGRPSTSSFVVSSLVNALVPWRTLFEHLVDSCVRHLAGAPKHSMWQPHWVWQMQLSRAGKDRTSRQAQLSRGREGTHVILERDAAEHKVAQLGLHNALLRGRERRPCIAVWQCQSCRQPRTPVARRSAR